jgi:hypothetical protein
MTIYPAEYTGEVAGMVGNSGQNFADHVSICYPKYEQGNPILLEWRHRISVSGLEAGDTDGCRNFRYGAAPHVGDTTPQENDWNVNIPVGIRSIRAEVEGTQENDRIYVFTVEPTGNFIGTVKVRKTGTPEDVPGDIDGDGEVGLSDYYCLIQALGSTSGDPNWNPAADLDEDGVVGLHDYYLFKQIYGQPLP